jgi:hypothetical protein
MTFRCGDGTGIEIDRQTGKWGNKTSELNGIKGSDALLQQQLGLKTQNQQQFCWQSVLQRS